MIVLNQPILTTGSLTPGSTSNGCRGSASSSIDRNTFYKKKKIELNRDFVCESLMKKKIVCKPI